MMRVKDHPILGKAEKKNKVTLLVDGREIPSIWDIEAV